MTDSELLEMAARAAGIYEKLGAWFSDGVARGIWLYETDGSRSAWNPLDDDGQALRLAVKLNIAIIQPESTLGTSGMIITDVFGGYCKVGSELASDQYAATRRAIVKAAAEIGAAMATS